MNTSTPNSYHSFTWVHKAKCVVIEPSLQKLSKSRWLFNHGHLLSYLGMVYHILNYTECELVHTTLQYLTKRKKRTLLGHLCLHTYIHTISSKSISSHIIRILFRFHFILITSISIIIVNHRFQHFPLLKSGSRVPIIPQTIPDGLLIKFLDF